MRYLSDITVQANTYQEAIGIVGEEMDHIWGNGNWELEYCHAYPAVYLNNVRPMLWDWDFRISWRGLKK